MQCRVLLINIYPYLPPGRIWGWLGFDHTLKADNHISFIVLRAKGMIGWMVRNFISREVNVVLKIYKLLIRPYIEYGPQARTPVLRHGNWKCNIEIGKHTKKSLIEQKTLYRTFHNC